MDPKADDASPPSARATVRRMAQRGRYDHALIYQILDEALICHVGFVEDGQPYVIPTNHVRMGDRLYMHGSPASRMLRCLIAGTPACVTATLLDGLVLARSAFHHSMNYRSVVILGTASLVTDLSEKAAVLDALVEQVIPGRSRDARKTTEKEMAATMIVSFPLDEASAKVRSGPPEDDEKDRELPIWAGIIPLELRALAPVKDPTLAPGIAAPDYAVAYRRPTDGQG